MSYRKVYHRGTEENVACLIGSCITEMQNRIVHVLLEVVS